MSINGKFAGITRPDLGRIADLFDLPRHGNEIIEEVIASLDHWRGYAAEADVPSEFVEYLDRRFERLP